jgi:hypothetical protein
MHALALGEHDVLDFPVGTEAASSVTAGAGTRLPVPAPSSTAVAASATGPGILRHTDRNCALVNIDCP